MFLIDTNVISEARKGCRADAGVRDFWAAVARDETLMQPYPPCAQAFRAVATSTSRRSSVFGSLGEGSKPMCR